MIRDVERPIGTYFTFTPYNSFLQINPDSPSSVRLHLCVVMPNHAQEMQSPYGQGLS